MYLLALISHTLSEKEVKMSGKYCFAGAAEIRSLSKLKISFNVEGKELLNTRPPPIIYLSLPRRL